MGCAEVAQAGALTLPVSGLASDHASSDPPMTWRVPTPGLTLLAPRPQPRPASLARIDPHALEEMGNESLTGVNYIERRITHTGLGCLEVDQRLSKIELRLYSVAVPRHHQCSTFPGIGPEAESNPVILRIKYGIIPKKCGIYPNPAAELKLG